MENPPSPATRHRHVDIAMHENSIEPRRRHENQVFFFTSPFFFRPPFSLASDGVRWFAPSSSYDFFHISLFSREPESRHDGLKPRRVDGMLVKVLTRYFHP